MEAGAVEVKVTYGSGNVFADLNLPEPEQLMAKARLASAIIDVIEARGLTQTKAAKIIGIDQPKVSKIVRGNLTEFSTERLMAFLVRLGSDIDIVVHRQVSNEQHEGRISVVCV